MSIVSVFLSSEQGSVCPFVTEGSFLFLREFHVFSGGHVSQRSVLQTSFVRRIGLPCHKGGLRRVLPVFFCGRGLSQIDGCQNTLVQTPDRNGSGPLSVRRLCGIGGHRLFWVVIEGLFLVWSLLYSRTDRCQKKMNRRNSFSTNAK